MNTRQVTGYQGASTRYAKVTALLSALVLVATALVLVAAALVPNDVSASERTEGKGPEDQGRNLSQDAIDARVKKIHDAESKFRQENPDATQKDVEAFLAERFDLVPVQSERATSDDSQSDSSVDGGASTASFSTSSIDVECDSNNSCRDALKFPKPSVMYDRWTGYYYLSAEYEWGGCDDYKYCWMKDIDGDPSGKIGDEDAFGVEFQEADVTVYSSGLSTYDQEGTHREFYDTAAHTSPDGVAFRGQDKMTGDWLKYYNWHEGLLSVEFDTKDGCDEIAIRQVFGHTYDDGGLESISFPAPVFTFSNSYDAWEATNSDTHLQYDPC